MKKALSFAAFCLFATISFAQILTPVSWDFAVEKTGENDFVVTYTADIDQGWVIYSQFLESTDGPIPTEFNYEISEGVEMVGKVEEHGTMKEEYDKLFDMNLKKLSGKVEFKQAIKATSGTKVTGYLTFMTCAQERCLPPTDVEFDITMP